jgi:hypothetical protein
MPPLRQDGLTVDVPAPPAAPLGFALDASAPNPFTRTTVLGFALPASGRADLRVYDARGREVARVAAGNYAAGRHVLAWHALDPAGRPLAPGAYFCRLRLVTVAGEAHETSRSLTIVH